MQTLRCDICAKKVPTDGPVRFFCHESHARFCNYSTRGEKCAGEDAEGLRRGVQRSWQSILAADAISELTLSGRDTISAACLTDVERGHPPGYLHAKIKECALQPLEMNAPKPELVCSTCVENDATCEREGVQWACSPMQIAVMLGHKDALQVLLQAGAPVDHNADQGLTLVHEAVILNQKVCLELLLQAGADHSAMDENQHTPAHLAARLGRLECLRMLVQAADADSVLSAKDTNKCTPAHHAARALTRLWTIVEFNILLYR